MQKFSWASMFEPIEKTKMITGTLIIKEIGSSTEVTVPLSVSQVPSVPLSEKDELVARAKAYASAYVIQALEFCIYNKDLRDEANNIVSHEIIDLTSLLL